VQAVRAALACFFDHVVIVTGTMVGVKC
jgi:hypothetical protein